MSPTKRRLVKTTIYLHRASLTALKKISNETLIPQAALIRKGIESVIKKYSKKQ